MISKVIVSDKTRDNQKAWCYCNDFNVKQNMFRTPNSYAESTANGHFHLKHYTLVDKKLGRGDVNLLKFFILLAIDPYFVCLTLESTSVHALSAIDNCAAVSFECYVGF